MNYAIVENGVVTNIIWLLASNENDFPSAIPIVDVMAGIGDTYVDGVFSRDGQPLLTPIQTAEATIASLDETVVNLEYQNALLELGV